MEKYVVRQFERPDKALIERLGALDVTTIYEAQGRSGLMHNRLRPVIPGSTACGPALTVHCQAGDSLMIEAALEVCQPGDLFVITADSDEIYGMVDDKIVSALIHKRIRGVVIDSGVRSVQKLRKLGLPIWAKGIYSRGATQSKGGWINVPVVCGECAVRPGDVILADDDGVVVVAKEQAQTVWEQARKRLRAEEEEKKKIARGELRLDFGGLRKYLQADNVHYYESELVQTDRKGNVDR
ncbi:4-carboxy-4-hydroxy-2-oxoadipate aldolase/oxaloacetate decarboxylase [Brevibacillus fulvus]|uniref:Putative 4-hydroxy-4-methyl-2-oxoglutarate aldolase n=1 Tax=Brevibacillus fulvus TaxID=1125967 RepID=A0A939BNE6_9BACL|nr:4-carboxy-4-hydroxy-2-oxoadipate aldolase/oxaloacetate decarboxylase [Brevibacillus fulvus]MBM7588930.1 4-hydroxy-4-methyl-2-oxoglutarate aldolase [Brevibacillus fulvus]